MAESISVPEGRELAILKMNRMDPDEYGIIRSQEDYIVVRCYASGCDIIINRGNRRWPE